MVYWIINIINAIDCKPLILIQLTPGVLYFNYGINKQLPSNIDLSTIYLHLLYLNDLNYKLFLLNLYNFMRLIDNIYRHRNNIRYFV